MEKILLSVHAICSGVLSIPELAIDESEAKLLADAAANVAKHYDFLPDPKTQAWVNLAMVAGAVYGPRAWVIFNRPKAQPGQPAQPTMQPIAGAPAVTADIMPWPQMGAGGSA